MYFILRSASLTVVYLSDLGLYAHVPMTRWRCLGHMAQFAEHVLHISAETERRPSLLELPKSRKNMEKADPHIG